MGGAQAGEVAPGAAPEGDGARELGGVPGSVGPGADSGGDHEGDGMLASGSRFLVVLMLRRTGLATDGPPLYLLAVFWCNDRDEEEPRPRPADPGALEGSKRARWIRLDIESLD